MCPQMIVPPMNYAARSLRLRIPRICVSITGTEAAELLDKAEAVLRENTLIELRLDYLKTPLAALPRLRRLMELRPDAIVIVTCRRTAAGGKFHGSVERRTGGAAQGDRSRLSCRGHRALRAPRP